VKKNGKVHTCSIYTYVLYCEIKYQTQHKRLQIIHFLLYITWFKFLCEWVTE
jgi:hypothetical protein